MGLNMNIGNRKTIYKIVSAIALSAVIFFIFYQSAQDGYQSSQSSAWVTAWIQSFFTYFGLTFTITETIVRTLAHLMQFFLFGLMIAIHLVLYRDKPWKQHFITLLVLLPIFDESLQYFVPGRAFEIQDLIVDYIGILLGFVLVVFIQKARYQRYLKNKQ